MSNKKTVVVGGGIVGILSAILRAQKGHSVVLIEQAKEFGGLLGSFKNENGAWFDYGTHVPSRTGVRGLDDILFGDERQEAEDYYRFDYLTSENYFGGKWFPTSPLVDARSLPEDIYSKGLVEMLESTGEDDEKNLEKFLIGHFGETYTDHIFRPVLKKLLGADPSGLHFESIRTFGLVRLIALTSEDTLLMKQIPKYDSRLGFHSYRDGKPQVNYLYPKSEKGIGEWVTRLIKKAKDLKIELVSSETVSKINVDENKNLKSIETANHGTIDCDDLIWTIATPIAYKAAGLEIKADRPTFRTTTLVHLQLDRELKKDFPQYLLCWDQNRLCYRITLYPNLSPDEKRKQMNNLTVEVLTDFETAKDQNKIKDQVVKELKEMDVIHANSKVIWEKVETIPNTFPVVTEKFLSDVRSLAEELEEQVNGVTVVGRGTGKAFFIKDLFFQAYERLK